jgi:hypothetical protein
MRIGLNAAVSKIQDEVERICMPDPMFCGRRGGFRVDQRV